MAHTTTEYFKAIVDRRDIQALVDEYAETELHDAVYNATTTISQSHHLMALIINNNLAGTFY
jgi:hypothetical protein